MKHIKLFESFDKGYLDEIVRGLWIENDDGSISVNGDVYLSRKDLDSIPYKFKNITDSFYIAGNPKLTTLENTPREVIGDFACGGTSIIDLKGGPSYVGGDYHLNDCKNLVSLFGCPDIINHELDIQGCYNLMSFDGIGEFSKYGSLRPNDVFYNLFEMFKIDLFNRYQLNSSIEHFKMFNPITLKDDKIVFRKRRLLTLCEEMELIYDDVIKISKYDII